MQIDNIGPNKLRPYPNNARTHSQKQIRQIAKSIEALALQIAIREFDYMRNQPTIGVKAAQNARPNWKSRSRPR
jgi:hypothetical protein